MINTKVSSTAKGRYPLWLLLLIIAFSEAVLISPKLPPIFRLYADSGLYPLVPGKALTIKDPVRGIVRDISYRVDNDGLAIYDGDIIFGTEQQLLAAAVSKEKRDDVSVENPVSPTMARSFSHDVAFPNGVIPFYFNTDADSNAQLANVNQAQARWTKVAPYLKFKYLGVNPTTGFGINITSTDTGCYTSDNALYKIFGPYNMSLNKTVCGVDQATHEFGHALGEIIVPYV